MWFRRFHPGPRAFDAGVFSRLLAALLILALSSGAWAQEQQAPRPDEGQQAPPEAGGPQGDVGPLAVPKKKEEPPPPPPPKPKVPADMPDYSIRVDVPLVTVPVTVTTSEGQFIPGLKKDLFRIFEDDVPQKIAEVTQSEAPITAVLVVEFASNSYSFMYDALNASYSFANSLKKEDWVAVVAFDMRPHILLDFTQDKGAVYGTLNRLRIPGFREVNVYDALYDTLDRIEGVEGRKYIVLISTGCDTFSKMNFDKVMRKVKETQNTVIFTVSTGKAMLLWADARGYGQQQGITPCSSQMDFIAADAQMAAFAKATGGRWFAPRFEAEMPSIFGAIGAEIRNEYVISYRPSNTKLDGSYRKLKVELVGPDGKDLVVKNEKGKEIKYKIIAREGYTARHVVE
jgi:VWFA-related protein